MCVCVCLCVRARVGMRVCARRYACVRASVCVCARVGMRGCAKLRWSRICGITGASSSAAPSESSAGAGGRPPRLSQGPWQCPASGQLQWGPEGNGQGRPEEHREQSPPGRGGGFLRGSLHCSLSGILSTSLSGISSAAENGTRHLCCCCTISWITPPPLPHLEPAESGEGPLRHSSLVCPEE